MDQNKKDSKPDDGIANGTLTINLPNFDAFNDLDGKAQQITSIVEKIGGLTWQMKVRKVLKPTRLNLYIHCNEAVKDRLWLCKVQFKIQAWVNGLDKLFYTTGQFFGFNSHFWLFPIKYRHYLMKEKGPIEIKLEVKLCKVQEKSMPTLDTSLVVNIGEGHAETLFVNKYAMASLSIYFRNLFFEDWRDKKEKDGNFFELYEPENFDIRAFKAMIYSAMTLSSCWMVEQSNFLDSELAVEIVKQSIKFDFPMLLDCCEQFLIDNSDQAKTAMTLLEFADQFNRHLPKMCFGPMLLLGFADRFNLVKLKEHCLEKMSVYDFSEFWLGMGMKEKEKREILLSRLSKATREQLLVKMDQKFDLNDYAPFSKMQVLELADHFNLNKLKQHCLDKLTALDYMRSSYVNHEITSRLSKATQEQLHDKLSGKAEELLNQTQELQFEVHRADRPEHVLVEQFDKLAGALLGEEEEESASNSE